MMSTSCSHIARRLKGACLSSIFAVICVSFSICEKSSTWSTIARMASAAVSPTSDHGCYTLCRIHHTTDRTWLMIPSSASVAVRADDANSSVSSHLAQGVRPRRFTSSRMSVLKAITCMRDTCVAFFRDASSLKRHHSPSPLRALVSRRHGIQHYHEWTCMVYYTHNFLGDACSRRSAAQRARSRGRHS